MTQVRDIGTVVTTIHGNKLRRFEDGWSPLKGAHWDRWTVYTDDELAANFTLVDQRVQSLTHYR
jgi:hypothetical protein